MGCYHITGQELCHDTHTDSCSLSHGRRTSWRIRRRVAAGPDPAAAPRRRPELPDVALAVEDAAPNEVAAELGLDALRLCG
jgi:hypothetical protein